MKKVFWAKLGESARRALLKRPALARSAQLQAGVSGIMSAVRSGGDKAVLDFTRRFDKASVKSLAVRQPEMARALRTVAPEVLAALRLAARRVKKFHQAQVPRDIKVAVSAGTVCERRFVPLEKVGLYVPGGTATLPSTVIMLGVPAALAGCPVKILATPPRRDGSVDPHVLAAAYVVGIQRVFAMGGAQAVAAMAYGTKSVPKVDKIFGPGNSWVTEAKLQAARDPDGAACDLPAGPTEVLVIADLRADAEFVASDLLAQAEHGRDSQVVLVTPSALVADRVLAEVARQLKDLPRREIASEALSHSLAIVVPDLAAALEVSNRYAPEHLILNVAKPRSWTGRVRHAGSVFLGPWSPEAAGDYASGTNHVLPTYGFARAYGGLTLESFLKPITFQELTQKGLRSIGPAIERLASIEALDGHRRSISRRLARGIKR
jgi:histidinol dehydrogenase